jgi:ceramide glucosyltransferase
MLGPMLYLFYILVVEQILQGLNSLRSGFLWMRMARQRSATPAGFYAPRVALLCPVKGLELGLEENLTALTQFDYAPYEIFFAVAGAKDAAIPLLQRIAAKSKRSVHIVEAGAARDCGEKVNNLRVAVEQAGGEFDVLVFADSDGRPPRRWLARLVAPLADQRVGAATTFRWLLPAGGGFWSALASAWNAPIATYLGNHNHNFCWGGGTALRRARFEEVRGQEAWSGSVSDDFSLTSALRNAGFPIVFVPEALVASPVDMDAHKLFEFTTRQLIITRVYAPKIWLQALIGHSLYCAAVLLGLGVWAATWAAGLPSLQILLLALLPPILCAVRGIFRLIAVLDLMPEWQKELLRYGWAWTLLAPLVPFLSLYNAIVAGFCRTITWRGTRYELISARQTQILAR